MDVCPECGKEEEFNSITCSHCGYTFRYGDRADYNPGQIVFKVEYECKNCGETFEHEFGEGDEVRPEGIGSPSFSIDEITGNPYLEVINGRRARPRCPTCALDTYLYILERTPI